jgi:hypothetical protein
LDIARMLRKKYGWQREAGFDAHVVKPVDAHLLESMLHTLFPEMRWMTKPIG